jgi:putative ABC transport system permease protein
MWTVTLADLRMRSRQFAIAVLGTTLVFAMALIMSGLSNGFRVEARRSVDAVGADGFLVPLGAGGPFTSQADLPGSLVSAMRRTPGVMRADPMVIVTETIDTPSGSQLVHVIGVPPGGLGSPNPGSGRAVRGRGEAVVDDLLQIGVGRQFDLAGLHFTAVGGLHGFSYLAGTPSMYVDLRDAQQIAYAGRPDITTVAMVGRPASVPKGLTVMTSAKAAADILQPLRNGIRSIDIIKALLWIVAVVIIGAVVYLSALERRRDFAVLKAIGSSTRWLFSGLAVQAAVLSLLAAGLALLLQHPIVALMPMPLAVPSTAAVTLPPVALLIGVMASLSGLRLAVRADPALAFGAA